jgi:hypothetical protein
MYRLAALSVVAPLLLVGWLVAPPALAQQKDVIVEEIIPIPPDEIEVIEEMPAGEDLLWVPGYWERDPGKWTWIKGRWEEPPHEKAHWRKGHWKWHEGKWHWQRGHWAVTGEQGWIVDELIDVPAPLKEKKPEKPAGPATWVPGYWDWQGSWHWTPGYWSHREHADLEFVPGHWQKAESGKWHWLSSHWKAK